MGKLVGIVWAVFVFAITGHAQIKGDVEFGIHSGLNITTNTVLEGLNFELNAGMLLDYYLSDRWSIKTKLLYDSKGWKKSRTFLDLEASRSDIFVINSESIKYNLNYATIPVTASLHFGKKRNGYIHMGPYVGFLMDSKKTRSKYDNETHFNDFDWGFSFGMGLKIPILNTVKLFFEYDTQAGAVNVLKNSSHTIANLRCGFNAGIKMMIE